MKLTDGEKLIILMLTDLQEKLQVPSEIEPEFLRSAIYNDHLWGIHWKYSGIPLDRGEDPPEVREVVDILDMWSFIETTYSDLNDAQKAVLAEQAKPFGEKPRFQGFDGNNETEYMSVAMFLVNQLDRFQSFKGRSFNCHFPSIEMHRRMLAVFEPMRRNLADALLSVDQLAEILKACIHPG